MARLVARGAKARVERHGTKPKVLYLFLDEHLGQESAARTASS